MEQFLENHTTAFGIQTFVPLMKIVAAGNRVRNHVSPRTKCQFSSARELETNFVIMNITTPTGK